MSGPGASGVSMVARPASPYVRATWQQAFVGPSRYEVVVGAGEVAVVVRSHAIDQVLRSTTAVALAGQALWWFRTEPASVRVAIDWQGGRERHRFAIDLEISFVVVDAAALATWLLDQQEPDDIVEVLVARAVSRRVSWLLAELGPVRSELQRVIVSEIRTNVIRPICPGVALRQVIISQCERQAPRATTAAGAGEAGRAGDTPPVTAATAAHRVEDLTNTEEIDVSSIMVGALAGDTNSEIVLFSSDVLPAVDNERAASEITAPSLAAARAAMATEDDSEPYADIEVAAPAAGVPSQEAHGSEPVEHPAYPFGARVRVADHRGRWQAAVVTRSAPHMLEVQMEHSGRVLSVTPTDVKPS